MRDGFTFSVMVQIYEHGNLRIVAWIIMTSLRCVMLAWRNLLEVQKADALDVPIFLLAFLSSLKHSFKKVKPSLSILLSKKLDFVEAVFFHWPNNPFFVFFGHRVIPLGDSLCPKLPFGNIFLHFHLLQRLTLGSLRSCFLTQSMNTRVHGSTTARLLVSSEKIN
jgi:hypothetical protein